MAHPEHTKKSKDMRRILLKAGKPTTIPASVFEEALRTGKLPHKPWTVKPRPLGVPFSALKKMAELGFPQDGEGRSFNGVFVPTIEDVLRELRKRTKYNLHFMNLFEKNPLRYVCNYWLMLQK